MYYNDIDNAYAWLLNSANKFKDVFLKNIHKYFWLKVYLVWKSIELLKKIFLDRLIKRLINKKS